LRHEPPNDRRPAPQLQDGPSTTAGGAGQWIGVPPVTAMVSPLM